MNIRTDVDLTQLTVADLEEMQQVLHGDMKTIKVHKKAVDAELQRRTIADAAVRKLAQMSPAERTAAAQLLGQAGGIPSGESVGTPGAR